MGLRSCISNKLRVLLLLLLLIQVQQLEQPSPRGQAGVLHSSMSLTESSMVSYTEQGHHHVCK